MQIEQKLLTDIQYNHFKEQMLYLDEKGLTDEDAFLLVEALKHNTYIKQINLKGNFISSLGAQSLATLTTLEALDVSENEIGPEGALALAKSHLKELNISGTPIGESIAAFATSSTLIQLDAAACLNLTELSVEPLFLSKTIKKLNLSYNQLSGKCLKNISSNTVLEFLDFSRNKLKDQDCCYYVAQNNSLKWLNLSHIFIKDEGAILLAKNHSLKNLLLRGCAIGDKGALALSKNNCLEALSLYRNKITETGASTFTRNTTLTYLSLEENPFNPLNVIELEKIYKKDDAQTYVRTKEDVEILLKKITRFKFSYYR